VIGTPAAKIDMPVDVTASNVGVDTHSEGTDVDVTLNEVPGDGTTVVGLHGQLDIDTADLLTGALSAVTRAPRPRIVVDMTGVTFCDSIGLSSLAVAHNRCTAGGGYLRIAAPSPFLTRVLSVVGLVREVPMYRSVEGARTGDETDRLTSTTDHRMGR
jgi:anti-sigma B factor antagonist